MRYLFAKTITDNGTVMKPLFRGLRFGGRLALLVLIIVLLVVTFLMSFNKMKISRNVKSEKNGYWNQLNRHMLHHPLILQPPVVQSYAKNSTVKAIVQILVDKYGSNTDMKLTQSPWIIAENWVKPREILPDNAPELGSILEALATSKIIGADFGYKGTQLKLSLILDGGQRVAFKPKWYARDFVILGKPYAGADRHNGEIASFHLNRVLGFRRAPLVVGRKVNLRTEVMPVASSKLLKTFFTRDNNTCFYGRCYYCKGEEDGVCAQGHVLEGTMVLWLPATSTLTNHRHPWARTYKDNVKARWEQENHYCDFVQGLWPYRHSSPEFLDLMDAAIFDYIIGNADRHNYETLNDTTPQRGMMLLIDSAKSFGNPFHDERSILAPILQCCRLRQSTYERLVLLQNGVLSDVMREVMSRDPIRPILFDPYYVAMDRRLATVSEVLQDCIQAKGGRDKVLVNDVDAESGRHND